MGPHARGGSLQLMRQTLARPADAERNPRTCFVERNRRASGACASILSFAVALHQSSGWRTDGACRTSVARSPCTICAARRSLHVYFETEADVVIRTRRGAPIDTTATG